MVECGDWPVGVCSWSLRVDILQVAEAMKKLGIEHIHLALGPALHSQPDKYLNAVRQQNWAITSTMIDFPQEDYSSLESIRLTGGIVPDDCWDSNRKSFFEAARITAELGVKYLSMHAGFLDHSDPVYAGKLTDRIKCLADAAAEQQVTLLLETGQESAEQLRHFLEKLNHPAVGVNFDPANMILYDKGEPIEAVRTLSPWIKHVHIKDAVRTTRAGMWGTEVPWGQGQVGGERFLQVLQQIRFKGALAIEREAGDDRLGDIKLAVQRLAAFKR
jgi:sugar phosphate isomerase/epimerase